MMKVSNVTQNPHTKSLPKLQASKQHKTAKTIMLIKSFQFLLPCKNLHIPICERTFKTNFPYYI